MEFHCFSAENLNDKDNSTQKEQFNNNSTGFETT